MRVCQAICLIPAIMATLSGTVCFPLQIKAMNKIELIIVALTNHDMQGSGYVLVLRERHGQRRLPVVIGAMEAQSIMQGSKPEEPARPMPHDAIHELLDHWSITLEEVHISDLLDHVFHATLYYREAGQQLHTIDARTSDALALALRAGCPIFTNPSVMEEAGVSWQPNPAQPADMDEMSNAQLHELLDEALEAEDFERAAVIRDELDRRTNT